MAWMVIRVRGTIHARHEIRRTLEELHLRRPNHATIVPEAPEFHGMLARVQGYVTWGEVSPETVGTLLARRGESTEGQGLTAETVSPLTGEPDLGALARAVLAGGLPRIRGIRPLFRLGAPKGGWRSTKKPFSLGGALGYRGASINELALRMV